MKKRTFAVLASAVVAAAALAGCSSNKATETTAAASAAVTTEAATKAAAEPADTAVKADIVIAGGDGAGLAAAIQAVKDGADPSKVIIIEKSDSLASDIAGMDSFMNVCNASEQFEQEIEDDPEVYAQDITKAGNSKNNVDLVEFVAGNSETALTWLNELGISLEGVTQEDGSSMARSYAVRGDQKLQDLLTDTLTKEAGKLNIQIMKNTTVEELLFDADGKVEGLKVKAADKEETINCLALLVTDKTLLPLMEKAPSVTFTTDDAGANTGVMINEITEVMSGEETIPGLYAAGSMTDAAVHGDKALPGNQITSMILFGSSSGTEMNIYVQDNSTGK